MIQWQYLLIYGNGKTTSKHVAMNYLHRIITVLLITILTGCATKVSQETPTKPGAAVTKNTIDLTQPTPDLWDRVRNGFAIPNIDTDLSMQWTNYYASHPQSVLLMVQRASKYIYHVVNELHQRGMPTELALLPFIESAYNTNALSRSKASGLWQFIPSTGRHYNLRQDWWQDQRRDPIASTNAALDYLAYLYEFQGDWHLALASYNWGEGAVKRAIEKNEHQNLPTDYLSLTMPEETKNYVPKLQAFKNIISEPKKYGLTLPQINNSPYFTTVVKSQDIDIEIAAKLAEMPVDEFKALNAAHNQPIILAEHNPVLIIPTDKIHKFNRNLRDFDGKLTSWQVQHQKNGKAVLVPHHDSIDDQKLIAIRPDTNNSIESEVFTHTIKRGDTLYNLARHYKTTVNTLRELNNLKNNHLATGKSLRVPKPI